MKTVDPDHEWPRPHQHHGDVPLFAAPLPMDSGASETRSSELPGNLHSALPDADTRERMMRWERSGPNVAKLLAEKRGQTHRRRLGKLIAYVIGYLLSAALLSWLIWQTYQAM